MNNSALNREVAFVLYEMAELSGAACREPLQDHSLQQSRPGHRIFAGGHLNRSAGRGDCSPFPEWERPLPRRWKSTCEPARYRLIRSFWRNTPAGLAELLQISGLGPKTIFMLHEKLNITNLEELEKAAKEHRIRRLPRMGPTRETEHFKIH